MLKKILLVFMSLGLSAAAFGGALKVDREKSSFTVFVKATGHSFDVVLTDYDVAVDLGEDGSVKAATFSFSPRDLDSDSKKRDKKMVGWLEIEAYPKIEFTLSEVKEIEGGKVGVGELTMHGVTRSVEVPFSMTKEGEQVSLAGSAVIDHTLHDLEVITMMFFKVNPELEVSFNLVGTAQ